MEIIIYFAVLMGLYYLWMKIKCFFTGRSVSEQISRDSKRVCRNCIHCHGNKCGEYDFEVNRDCDCCDSFSQSYL